LFRVIVFFDAMPRVSPKTIEMPFRALAARELDFLPIVKEENGRGGNPAAEVLFAANNDMM
jgi:hypothetical protein